ncbi:hypothetical protein MSG28_006252 [Choristoneura fumiferana]|uniref:Uncharacterized protein n=1 Tax=Choristoneura fumiferana TaxID=7141 RepID=A0ACC0JE81_CHOFU|nr:hypothetical protein MSG28_006252 [Choristoneura fumiferana]
MDAARAPLSGVARSPPVPLRGGDARAAAGAGSRRAPGSVRPPAARRLHRRLAAYRGDGGVVVWGATGGGRGGRAAAVGARGAGAAGEARAQAALGTYLAPSANTDARLCVDLSSWDLCCDARWAARRARLPALAAEAAALAHHTARLPQVVVAGPVLRRALGGSARAPAALAAEAAALAHHTARLPAGRYIPVVAGPVLRRALAARRARLPALAAEAAALAHHTARLPAGRYTYQSSREARAPARAGRGAPARWSHARRPRLAHHTARLPQSSRDLCCDGCLPALAAEAAALAHHTARLPAGRYTYQSSRDLCCDARWAARRARLPALAAEAAALAHHTARLPAESVCSESCSQCSSCSGSDDESSASRGSRARPPPLPRVPLPLLPVPPAPDNPPPATSIRPNLHQYLEKNNTIWNTDVREKKWPSLENVLKQNVEVIPRPLEDKLASVHFRHLFQTELREDAPNMYRYHGNYRPGSAGERAVKFDNGAYERSNRPPGEKNKVKFSDTVTIAVVAAKMLLKNRLKLK